MTILKKMNWLKMYMRQGSVSSGCGAESSRENADQMLGVWVLSKNHTLQPEQGAKWWQYSPDLVGSRR